MKTVPEALRDLGELYRQRNKVYGNDYKYFGTVMAGMFPEGVMLKTATDFGRFALFMLVTMKINRYSKSFLTGGHADSLDDNSVYSQMLREYDDDQRHQPARRNHRRRKG